MKGIFGIAIFLLLSTAHIYGHGDLDKRIAQATLEISANRENENLYFNRGKLYYQHEEYQNAIADFVIAVNKGFTNEQVHLFKSKCHFELEDYESSLSEIRLFFGKDPNHVIGHNHYGKILNKQGAFQESALEFEYVIDKAIRPLPENYINAADSWVALQNTKGIDNAVRILQKGIEAHGALLSLQNHLITLLTTNERFDKAIEIQKEIIQNLNRKESGYYKLYEIYMLKGDNQLAIAALKEAEKSWNQLPQRVKKNSAMINLMDKIQTNKTYLTSNSKQ